WHALKNLLGGGPLHVRRADQCAGEHYDGSATLGMLERILNRQTGALRETDHYNSLAPEPSAFAGFIHYAVTLFHGACQEGFVGDSWFEEAPGIPAPGIR